MVIPQSLIKPKERGRVDKAELIALYVDEKKSVRDCADYFGVSIQGITGYLSRHGIRKNSKDIQDVPKRNVADEQGVKWDTGEEV